MDSGLLLSFPTACSHPLVFTGTNIRRSKHSANNIYYASSCGSKASQQKRRMQYNVLMFQQLSLNNHYKCMEGSSTYQECNRKYVVKAVYKSSFDSEPHASDPKNALDFVKNFLTICYNFFYPYAMISIALCTISSSFLTVEKLSDISSSFIIGTLQAIVPQLLISNYVSAVNQVFDYEIDKINKSYLPLASGQLSFKTVVIVAVSFLITGFGVSWITHSWPLIWNVILTSSIWSAYSFDAPLLRWKRHPLLSAMCMISIMAFIIPITSFFHMQTFVLKRPFVFSRSLIFYVVFMSLYSLGLGMAKDIPDIEGDKTHGVDTLSVRLGKKRVLWICVSLLEMAFGVSFLATTLSFCLWIKIIMGLGHAIVASTIWYQAKSIDLNSKTSIQSFYMWLWKLLYAAYFLIALIR